MCSRWRRRRTSARRRRSTSTGTNIGSDLRRKVINDAAASLRVLAKSHGRNAAWADAAVRKASNLTAEEALHMNVIDLISPSLPALLNTIDGTVTVPRHLTSAHRRRADHRRPPRVLHPLPVDADRPEHRLAALPRGPRGPRLRALPSGRRHSGRVRRDLHGVRPLRVLGPAALVGRADPGAARRRAARRRRARDVARRPDALGSRCDGRRASSRCSTRLPRRTTRRCPWCSRSRC